MTPKSPFLLQSRVKWFVYILSVLPVVVLFMAAFCAVRSAAVTSGLLEPSVATWDGVNSDGKFIGGEVIVGWRLWGSYISLRSANTIFWLLCALSALGWYVILLAHGRAAHGRRPSDVDTDTELIEGTSGLESATARKIPR